MQTLTALSRALRALVSYLTPLALTHAKNNVVAYGTASNDIGVYDMTPRQQTETSDRFDALIITGCFIAMGIFFALVGMAVGDQFNANTDPVMDGFKSATVNGMYAVLFLGFGFGFLGVCLEKIEDHVRAALCLIGISFLTLSISFLWVAVINPHMDEIMEYLRLAIDIKSGSDYSPIYTG